MGSPCKSKSFSCPQFYNFRGYTAQDSFLERLGSTGRIPASGITISIIIASERLQRQIDRLLDEAEQAIAQRDWPSVQERAQDVLAIDPEHQEGQAFLATAERALSGSVSPSTTQRSSSPPPTTSSKPSDQGQTTSFANGRYQVKQFLGEGGKQQVYLAHDTLLDREVAFALIKTDGLVCLGGCERFTGDMATLRQPGPQDV